MYSCFSLDKQWQPMSCWQLPYIDFKHLNILFMKKTACKSIFPITHWTFYSGSPCRARSTMLQYLFWHPFGHSTEQYCSPTIDGLLDKILYCAFRFIEGKCILITYLKCLELLSQSQHYLRKCALYYRNDARYDRIHAP